MCYHVVWCVCQILSFEVCPFIAVLVFLGLYVGCACLSFYGRGFSLQIQELSSVIENHTHQKLILVMLEKNYRKPKLIRKELSKTQIDKKKIIRNQN